MINKVIFVCLLFFLVNLKLTKPTGEKLENTTEENSGTPKGNFYEAINTILHNIENYLKENLNDKITDTNHMESNQMYVKKYLCATDIKLGGLKHFRSSLEQNDDPDNVRITVTYEFNELVLYFGRLVVVSFTDKFWAREPKVETFTDKSQPLYTKQIELVVSYRRDNILDQSLKDCLIQFSMENNMDYMSPENIVENPGRYHPLFTMEQHPPVIQNFRLEILNFDRSKKIQILTYLMGSENRDLIPPAFFAELNNAFREAVNKAGTVCVYKGLEDELDVKPTKTLSDNFHKYCEGK